MLYCRARGNFLKPIPFILVSSWFVTVMFTALGKALNLLSLYFFSSYLFGLSAKLSTYTPLKGEKCE